MSAPNPRPQPPADRVARIVDARNFYSSGVSTQVRSLALGLLALAWLFLSGDKAELAAKFGRFQPELLIVAAATILSLFADLTQYLCGLWESDSALKRLYKEGKAYKKFDVKRIGVTVSFWVKIAAASFATILMLYTISKAIL